MEKPEEAKVGWEGLRAVVRVRVWPHRISDMSARGVVPTRKKLSEFNLGESFILHNTSQISGDT